MRSVAPDCEGPMGRTRTRGVELRRAATNDEEELG